MKNSQRPIFPHTQGNDLKIGATAETDKIA
jgi:hypothetical protein